MAPEEGRMASPTPALAGHTRETGHRAAESRCWGEARASGFAVCVRGSRLGGVRASSLLVAVALLASVAASTPNYYNLLGVRRTADTATIKKAYKELAKKYHPDKFKTKGNSPVKMEDLNRAHEVLTDPELRKRYDQYGKDPEDQSVQRAEEQRQRQQEYAQLHNIFNSQQGRRNHQYIESQTQTLTGNNYEELVNGMGQVWLIQVWRDTSCPHCHEIAPAWEEAAKELKGVVHLGRINYARNGVLLTFRLRQLPTIFAVTGRGEIRVMNARNGYSADEMVKFASGIVTSTSSVERIDSRSAKRWLDRPANLDKVHVILFDASDWAAYHSAAMAQAWKDTMVFAVFARPTLNDAFSRQFSINPDERSVVIMREDGTFQKKTGIRSRKVLVRFLLQHQFLIVPRVTAQNWAQICLGVGSSALGLHTIEHLLPARRTNNTVCVLSMRNASDVKRRPEIAVLRETSKLLDEDRGGGSERVQFGWIVADKTDRLWKYLVEKKMVDVSQEETVAMVDWQRGWCMAVGKKDMAGSNNAHWLKTWVKQGLDAIEETDEEVPVVSFKRSAVEQLISMFSGEGSGGAGGEDGAANSASKGGWSTWMGFLFLVLALSNFLSNKVAQAHAGSGGGSSQRQGTAPNRQSSSSAQQGAGARRAREPTSQQNSTPGPESADSRRQSGASSTSHTGTSGGGGGPPKFITESWDERRCGRG